VHWHRTPHNRQLRTVPGYAECSKTLKSWLFAGTVDGAAASILQYSQIETAKMNNLEPYAYLRYIFSKLPPATSLEDYEAMLPWNITPHQLDLPGLIVCR